MTIVLTPLAFTAAPFVARVAARAPLIGAAFRASPRVLADEAALTNHAVVVGYGRVGRHVADGLHAAGVPVVVLEEDLHLVQELGRASVPAVYGDAAHRTVLAATHPERARPIVVALPDAGATRSVVHEARRVNPVAPILARLSPEDEAEPLLSAGATATIGPELAGAVLLLRESKRLLGIVRKPTDTDGDGGRPVTVAALPERSTP